MAKPLLGLLPLASLVLATLAYSVVIQGAPNVGSIRTHMNGSVLITSPVNGSVLLNGNNPVADISGLNSLIFKKNTGIVEISPGAHGHVLLPHLRVSSPMTSSIYNASFDVSIANNHVDFHLSNSNQSLQIRNSNGAATVSFDSEGNTLIDASGNKKIFVNGIDVKQLQDDLSALRADFDRQRSQLFSGTWTGTPFDLASINNNFFLFHCRVFWTQNGNSFISRTYQVSSSNKDFGGSPQSVIISSLGNQVVGSGVSGFTMDFYHKTTSKTVVEARLQSMSFFSAPQQAHIRCRAEYMLE